MPTLVRNLFICGLLLVPLLSYAKGECKSPVWNDLVGCLSDQVTKSNNELYALIEEEKLRDWSLKTEQKCQEIFDDIYPGREAAIDQLVCLLNESEQKINSIHANEFYKLTDNKEEYFVVDIDLDKDGQIDKVISSREYMGDELYFYLASSDGSYKQAFKGSNFSQDGGMVLDSIVPENGEDAVLSIQTFFPTSGSYRERFFVNYDSFSWFLSKTQYEIRYWQQQTHYSCEVPQTISLTEYAENGDGLQGYINALDEGFDKDRWCIKHKTSSANSSRVSGECLSEAGLHYSLSTTSSDDVQLVNIYAAEDKTPLYSTEIFACDDCELLTFVDIDFDSQNELLVQYDDDPTHSDHYEVLNLDCAALTQHQLIPTLGDYTIDKTNKILTTDFKITNRWGSNKYCYEDKTFFQCYSEIAIVDDVMLQKAYDITGSVQYLGAKRNGLKVAFPIKEKSFLHHAPGKPTGMYLVEGDRVSLLDEQTDEAGYLWYFVNYQGAKSLDMWVTAGAVDVDKPQANELKSGVYQAPDCDAVINLTHNRYTIHFSDDIYSGELNYAGEYANFDGFDRVYYDGEDLGVSGVSGAGMPARIEKHDEFSTQNYGNAMNPFLFPLGCEGKFSNFILKKEALIVKAKAHLYTSLFAQTKKYLIPGDIVTLLDEKTDSEGQGWYFINYKGAKDINMWVKAEAIDTY